MWEGGCGNWWVPNAFPFRYKLVSSSAECDEECNKQDGCENFFVNKNPSWRWCLLTTGVCTQDSNPYWTYYKRSDNKVGTT